jgi:type IV pilus assembly protein PilX
MINRRCLTRFDRHQHGVALITGLIFLVVLTLIGITAARMAGLEERMSGNMRDRSLAVQAAEMALRDAERDIRGGAGITRAPAISGISNFVSACTNGLCYNGIQGNADGVDWNVTPIWSTVDMTAAPSVAYGTNTGATAIAGIWGQPRYIIEGIKKVETGEVVYYYRITTRAVGANPNTVVWLQEVFRL